MRGYCNLNEEVKNLNRYNPAYAGILVENA